MTKLTVVMECGHSIEWGEELEMPGAALPSLTGTAYCHECESDQEMTSISPSPVTWQTLKLNEQVTGYILYDFNTSTWGYTWGENGVSFDGFANAALAEDAMRDHWAEWEPMTVDTDAD